MTIVLKLLMTVAGFVLMLLGVVVTPLPGPFGVPIILLGLILVLRGSTWVKRHFVKLVHKYPKIMGPIRALLRPGAKVVALLWMNTLRIERRVMPRRFRFMYRFRHELKSLLHMRFRRPRWQLIPA